jgi:TetR/AcrR family transcriptional regulator
MEKENGTKTGVGRSTGRMSGSDRRRQLLESALDVFARKGYGGATTKEIASAAGVTEAVLFHHFPTKQDLYTAVLSNKEDSARFQACLGDMDALIERNDDRGLIRAMGRAMLTSIRADDRRNRVLMFAALEGHELGLALAREMGGPFYQKIRQYIERRQAEGALRLYSSGLMFAAITGLLMHYAVGTQMFGFPIENTDDEAVEAFTNIALNGIAQKQEL